MAASHSIEPVQRDRSFWPLTGAAVVLGAVIRFVYVVTDDRALVVGDGFSYHADALRLADGLGYTAELPNGGSEPFAHHPPGWVTVLGAVSWFGGRSEQTHQIVGVVIGLGVIALAALVGRRYFTPRVGVIAALLAAVYPGFWVLEGNILSEPLGLLILGVLTLLLFDLRERPTLVRSISVGAVLGLLGLVRSEEIALLVFVVAPILLLARTLTWGQRMVRLGAVTLTMVALLAPWAIYNQTRFKDPVLLSSNGGGTLLAGNCPPTTYRGKYLGFYDTRCLIVLGLQHPGLDRSEFDPLAGEQAFQNMSDHADQMPVTVLARFGRTIGGFRPSQTVGFVADWMGTGTRPIWAWIISFWALIPLAVVGVVSARRSRAFILPLVAPLLIVVVTVALSYGEPRYHTSADLGVVVLAALGVDRVLAALRRTAIPTGQPEPTLAETLPPVNVP